MFLNEVVLGKEHHITTDDWTLKAPPGGYDCIIAKGRTEPGRDFSLSELPVVREQLFNTGRVAGKTGG